MLLANDECYAQAEIFVLEAHYEKVTFKMNFLMHQAIITMCMQNQ